jgi:dethiobiotin synthetase
MLLLKNRFKKIIFVTGTDTGVGKTVASSALLSYLSEKKIKCGYIKPIQTGNDNDLQFIKQKTGLSAKHFFCPLHLKYPLAPQQAAELERLPHIDQKELIKKIKDFAEKFTITMVEGAGGLFVPIRPNYFMLDLIRDLNASTIIVSRTGLGTINHTLLTSHTLAQKKVNISGLIFNSSCIIKNDISTKLNPQLIQELTKLPLLGILPFQKPIDSKALAKYINWKI